MNRSALRHDIDALARQLAADGMPISAEAWRELAQGMAEDECAEFESGGRAVFGFRPAFLWGTLAGILGTVAVQAWQRVFALAF